MPSTTDARLSIIAIGNPGCGKSTTLNYLAQQKVFQSGVSYGSGMTGALDVQEVNGITYCDTPGLNDAGKRKAAGKAISEALKKGGDTKIIFFVGEESGRPKQDDVTTMNLVLKAAPEIGNKYGVIVPKVNAKMTKKFLDRSTTNWTTFLDGLFRGLGENQERQCPVANVQGVQLHEDLESEDNVLAPQGTLKTLDGLPLEKFVANLLPSIDLTPNKADDVDTASFEKKQEEIVKLMERAASNEARMKRLEKEVEEAIKAQGVWSGLCKAVKDAFKKDGPLLDYCRCGGGSCSCWLDAWTD